MSEPSRIEGKFSNPKRFQERSLRGLEANLKHCIALNPIRGGDVEGVYGADTELPFTVLKTREIISSEVAQYLLAGFKLTANFVNVVHVVALVYVTVWSSAYSPR